MSALPVFLELQSVHDNLATIQRDLTAFPPEMSKLDSELKTVTKSLESAEKSLADANTSLGSLSKDLQQAEKFEGIARTAVKSATQKVQFTAAIRELDERERQKAAVLRPLKEAESRRVNFEHEIEKLRVRKEDLTSQFAALHEIFLAEHENQVSARKKLQKRKEELESQLEQGDLSKFNRLLQARQGRAVVSVENGACTGCRTKIRTPLLYELREKSTLFCENCQRILYIPPLP
jgi:uncharacterized protein